MASSKSLILLYFFEWVILCVDICCTVVYVFSVALALFDNDEWCLESVCRRRRWQFSVEHGYSQWTPNIDRWRQWWWHRSGRRLFCWSCLPIRGQIFTISALFDHKSLRQHNWFVVSERSLLASCYLRCFMHHCLANETALMGNGVDGSRRSSHNDGTFQSQIGQATAGLGRHFLPLWDTAGFVSAMWDSYLGVAMCSSMNRVGQSLTKSGSVDLNEVQAKLESFVAWGMSTYKTKKQSVLEHFGKVY